MEYGWEACQGDSSETGAFRGDRTLANGMMKFLFALGQTPFDSTSGAAQASLHLAVLFAAGGHEVVFLATSRTEGSVAGGSGGWGI